MFLWLGHALIRSKCRSYLIYYLFIHLLNDRNADIWAKEVAQIGGVCGNISVAELWEGHHSLIEITSGSYTWIVGLFVFLVFWILGAKHVLEHVPRTGVYEDIIQVLRYPVPTTILGCLLPHRYIVCRIICVGCITFCDEGIHEVLHVHSLCQLFVCNIIPVVELME